ncbi:MAG: hypothetical protein J6U54_11610 [Clostridiales bacterium]|nr:hypothetical protein [Clostridiales bacterium]
MAESTLHYYAQRRVINEGQPVAQQNSLQFGTRRQMERQYCLFRANALENETQAYDIIQIEWGTMETGHVERMVYIKEQTPEPAPEGNGEGGEGNPETPTEGE